MRDDEPHVPHEGFGAVMGKQKLSECVIERAIESGGTAMALLRANDLRPSGSNIFEKNKKEKEGEKKRKKKSKNRAEPLTVVPSKSVVRERLIKYSVSLYLPPSTLIHNLVVFFVFLFPSSFHLNS